jgi:DNA-binding Lrp family transcriptional regulator
VTLQSESPLDATDWKILRELQQDARLSYNELGRRVALSAPAAAERVRKLEDRGVITRYAAQVDPEKVGCAVNLENVFVRTAAPATSPKSWKCTSSAARTALSSKSLSPR